MKTRSLGLVGLLITISLVNVGCGPPQVDTTYGRSRGMSINGTGTFIELLRQRGHEVRVALRATETLADWANVVVRFAGAPGPPDVKEGKWLMEWLMASPGRKLVYIPRDFDSDQEFWEAMLAAQPSTTKPEEVERVKQKRDHARSWVSNLPTKAKDPVKQAEWFGVDPKPALPAACKTLDGPWAEDIDANLAAVSKHEGLTFEGDESVLLSGDGSPLVINWNLTNGSQVLVVANASFLLNASMVNLARRPLAMKVVEWIGETPLQVASIERRGWLGDNDEDGSGSQFHLLTVKPFDWVSAHLMIFLFVLALSLAVRLGRARSETPSGVEKPSAHPEALGSLLAKTGRADVARFLLEAYRRWRHPSQTGGRSAPAPPPPSR